MNSTLTLNYETRPVKFTERKMLLASISKLLYHFGGVYQYIGLGGITFTDFKLFHKELHLNEMYSIEGGEITVEKLDFNKPFGFIKIIPMLSTIALTSGKIDLTKKSLVWLDYDDCLENFFFDDITVLFSKLPAGSIYIVTCNRQLDNKKSNVPYSVEDFKEKFGSNTPFDLQNAELSRKNSYKGLKKALKLHIDNILKQRSVSEGIKFQFDQLFNILYCENRGAEMYTYGGVISTPENNIETIDLSEFDFIKTNDEIYELLLPNLSRKEIDLVSAHIHDKERELLNMNIVAKNELDMFRSIYKYMPHFLDVRM
ncbi:O-methyltransferase [Flavobacterium sp.]|uniref:O-methyltransferase n=1 Tax=Flavobacterium sp. TaxID=239 RepID=UPI002625D6BD|nr:O-methyltransferase [Flavobacterium sp.]